MASLPSRRGGDEAPLTLVVTRSRAESVLKRHRDEGAELLRAAKQVDDEDGFRNWDAQRRTWESVTQRALTTLFNTQEPAAAFLAAISVDASTPQQHAAVDFKLRRRALEDGVVQLRALIEQLEYLDETPSVAAVLDSDTTVQTRRTDSVFIVHGRNDLLKTTVARVLERTGDHPVVILHEQANLGKTLIEKFEDHAGSADFAVVICSADDVGGLAPSGNVPSHDHGTDRPRARQNVIFELGYFVGKLGRSRVAVLYETGVELPSDYSGVTYTPIDEAGSWRYALLRELRSAGLSFDLNKLP